jgi:uncharacterized protein
MPASAGDLFAWHERVGAFERLTPPWERVQVIDRAGGIAERARVCLEAKVGPIKTHWLVEHRETEPGVKFCDVQIEGPFAEWKHWHLFDEVDAGHAVMEDRIRYRLPGGAAGRWLGRRFVRRQLERLFAYRHETLLRDVEQLAESGHHPRIKVAVSGGTGLIGRHLWPFLSTQGHFAAALSRGAARDSDREIFWDPARCEIEHRKLEGFDAVVHLAGANVGSRWTAKRRREILDSRVEGTRFLRETFQRMKRPPSTLVCASATGFYGDTGDEMADERSAQGDGFLADVCADWEREAKAFEELGVRVVMLRFGVVLTPAGGALAKMLPIFKAGLGGRIGSGRQWMSWIDIDDLLRAVQQALLEESWSGPYNVVAPEPVTNAQFAKTLASALGRPAVMPAPGFALKAAFGQMATETLLQSSRVAPRRIEEAGFAWRYPDLDRSLRRLLGHGIK